MEPNVRFICLNKQLYLFYEECTHNLSLMNKGFDVNWYIYKLAVLWYVSLIVLLAHLFQNQIPHTKCMFKSNFLCETLILSSTEALQVCQK